MLIFLLYIVQDLFDVASKAFSAFEILIILPVILLPIFLILSVTRTVCFDAVSTLKLQQESFIVVKLYLFIDVHILNGLDQPNDVEVVLQFLFSSVEYPFFICICIALGTFSTEAFSSAA